MDAAAVVEATVLKLEPGDVLIVKVIDADDAEHVLDVFNRALEKAGKADEVACILHDGQIEMTIVRSA